MNRLIIGTFGLILLLSLVSCGNNDGYHINAHLNKATTCVIENNFIVCPDGSKLEVKSGNDGKDGIVPLIQINVAAGSCTEVYPSVYVENINHGEIYDVYYNDQCTDSLGEYCDNVETSYGSSGTFGSNKKGNGGVCWADKLFITGSQEDDDSITIRVMDFN